MAVDNDIPTESDADNERHMKNVYLEMAKITRRAAASSSSTLSSIKSTTSSDTSRSSTATSSSTSKASKSTVKASATIIKTTTNANQIVNGVKPARLAATDMLDKLAMPLIAFTDTSILRKNGGNAARAKQFATNGNSGALPNTNTTTTTTGTAFVYDAANEPMQYTGKG
ncbi:PREDICTED: extracellular glycosidase CRH11-like, partial [Rhagoletis zephyria]|uniref:extracellular glycosidase CRH11-like n=1 Tax=Rhagoletis zephyria TaxID=28612 RepID=UPI00081143A4